MSFDASQFLAGLRGSRQKLIAAALRATDQFGEQVVGDAQSLCPVDTGALAASGTTTPAAIDGDKITKTVGFNADYAAAVHENLTAHHDVGQAKYLETALSADAPKFLPFLASKVGGQT